MKELPQTTLARATEAAYEDAVSTWRAKYAAHIAASDIFADVVRGIDIRVKIRPRGLTTILVDVESRRLHEAETYFYTLRKGPGGDELRHHIDNPLP